MVFQPNYSDELVIENDVYRSYLLELFELLLKYDLGHDNLSNSYFQSTDSIAKVKSKSRGMLACRSELEFLVSTFTNASVEFLLNDGEFFIENDLICILSGEAKDILTIERIFLNLLSRACGISLRANDYVQSLNTSSVLMTRKCLLGLYDKKAGSIAGAFTHRLNLSDAIMFKDNHHSLFEMEDIFISDRARFIDIECSSQQELERTLKFYSNSKIEIPKIIMLDNFSPEEVRLLIKNYDFLDIYLEVSGGITLSNIAEYDIDGVSFISTSDICANPYLVDLSLNFDRK
jgi:nicotinate-nucleotide pyrophosphorylase (carboxylating)